VGDHERDGVARGAKLPHAYRNLNDKSDIQGPEDYWNRVSWRSNEPTTNHTPSIEAKYRIPIPGSQSQSRSEDTRGGQHRQSGVWTKVSTWHEVG